MDIRPTTINRQDHPPSANPLTIPEILTQVGYFLPLWVPDGHGNYDDNPRAITNCMLVSKHWYDVMVPVLWHTCLSARITATPPQVLGRILHHIRILETNMRFPLIAFQCNRLVGLAVLMRSFRHDTFDHNDNDSEEQQDPHVRSLNLYKRLVRSNPRLKDLWWSGNVFKEATLDPDDFTGLIHLETLTLLRWDGAEGLLAEALRAVSRTLTDLTLEYVDGHEGDITIDGGSSKETDNGKGAGDPNNDGDHGLVEVKTMALCLPVLRNLVLDKTEWAEWLVGCCPSLELLDIRDHEELNTGLIAQGIREASRATLRILHISHILTSPDALPLLESCLSCEPGLQHLSLNLLELDANVVSRILLHGPTLKTLDLTVQRCHASCLRRVLQLVGGCPQHLESLSLTIRENYGDDLVAALGSRPWGCRRLKEMYLDLALKWGDTWPPVQEDEAWDAGLQVLGEEREEEWEKEKEGKEEEKRDIEALRAMTSTRSAMGWRLETDRQPNELPSGGRQLRRVFKMCNRLGLDELHTIDCDGVTYRRVSSP